MSHRITNHAARITHHASRITHHASRIANHASRITNHESRVTNHASHPTHHLPRIPSHPSRSCFLFECPETLCYIPPRKALISNRPTQAIVPGPLPVL